MRLSALALAASVLFCQARAEPTTEIRVRVQRAKSKIEVAGFGLRISPPTNVIAVAIPDSKLSRAKISRTKKGMWLVQRRGEKTIRFDTDRLIVRGQMLRIGLEAMPHNLEVLPNPGTGLDVVARLDMESYLAGVLPSEMPASWPIEALKAQAVAARSYVLRTAFERRNKHFDVDSTVMDQVYKFLHEAKDHPEWKERIARVIDETRGEILRDSKGRIVKAFYSADCGCQTEDPKFVWGKTEAMQSVKDPSCKDRKPRQWNLSLKKSEVRKKLLAALSLPDDASLRTIQVAGRTPSGRVAAVVASLKVAGETKQYMLHSQEFRKIFGFEKIRSTDFKLRWAGAKMQILGSGMGHGVGLCQTGARALAESGMDYREILKLYYPKVKFSSRDKPSKRASPHQSNVVPHSRGPA